MALRFRKTMNELIITAVKKGIGSPRRPEEIYSRYRKTSEDE